MQTVWGICGVSPEEEKEGYGGKELQKKNIKEDFKPGTKECGGNCIIISVNVSSVTTV